MRIAVFFRQNEGVFEKFSEGGNYALYDLVHRAVLLLDILATDLVREGDDLCLYYVGQEDTPWYERYIGFFDRREGVELFANLLKAEVYRIVGEKCLHGFGEGFLYYYMPKLLDNLELDPEKRLKAVAAVLYGGARRREDVERLMELDWKSLIAAIRISQDEGVSAIEILNIIEPVAD